MRTSVEAVRVGWPAFVVPFLFAASPSLLMMGTPVWNVVAAVTACAGVALLTAAVAGFAAGPLAPGLRLAMAVPGVLLLLPPELLPLAPLVYLLAAAAGAGLWWLSRPRPGTAAQGM
jgi:TRAP-type uncharacterized transport system fused permease subunit